MAEQLTIRLPPNLKPPAGSNRSLGITSAAASGNVLIISGEDVKGSPIEYQAGLYHPLVRLNDKEANFRVNRGRIQAEYGAPDTRLGIIHGAVKDISDIDSIPITELLSDLATKWNAAKDGWGKIGSAKPKRLAEIHLINYGGQLALALVSTERWGQSSSASAAKQAWLPANDFADGESVREGFERVFSLFFTVGSLLQNDFIGLFENRGGTNYDKISIVGHWLRGTLSDPSEINEGRRLLKDVSDKAATEGFQGAFQSLLTWVENTTSIGGSLFTHSGLEASYYRVTMQNLKGGVEADNSYGSRIERLSELPDDLEAGINGFVASFDSDVKKYDGLGPMAGMNNPIVIDANGIDGVSLGMRYRQIADALQTRINNEMPDYGDVLKTSKSNLTFDDFHSMKRDVAPKILVNFDFTVDDRDGGIVSYMIRLPPSMGCFAPAGTTLRAEMGKIVDGAVQAPSNKRITASGAVRHTYEMQSKKFGQVVHGVKIMVREDGTGALTDLNTQVTPITSDFAPRVLNMHFASTLHRGGSPGELQIVHHLADEYFQDWADGVLEGVESFLHPKNVDPEQGKPQQVKLEAGVQTRYTVDGLNAEEFVLSSRYLISGGDKSPFVSTGPVAPLAAPVGVPPPTSAELVTDATDAIDDAQANATIMKNAPAEIRRAEEQAREAKRAYEQFALDHQSSSMISGQLFLKPTDPEYLLPDPAGFPLDKIPKVNASEMAEFVALRMDAIDAINYVDDVKDRRDDAVDAADGHRDNVAGVTNRAVLARIDDLAKSVESAQAKKPTVDNLLALITKTTYSLPVDGMPGDEGWKELTEGERTYLTANREKIRVLMEKGVLPKGGEMTPKEVVVALKDALSRSQPGTMSKVTGYQAPGARLLKARTRGIGKPFMKRNARRLRFRPA